jgi:hypothetical protein
MLNLGCRLLIAELPGTPIKSAHRSSLTCKLRFNAGQRCNLCRVGR